MLVKVTAPGKRANKIVTGSTRKTTGAAIVHG